LRRDTAGQPENPLTASVIAAMPFKVWLRPIRSVDRVGEYSATVCHCVYVRPFAFSLSIVAMSRCRSARLREGK
jgi:hypothetical protein